MEQGGHCQEWTIQWRHPVEGNAHYTWSSESTLLWTLSDQICHLHPIKQYEDLEDSMTDALINDKPQFVRLFAENGLNILDYLTYGRLETLYQSVADGTLLYQLLQRRLVERMGTTAFVRTPSTAQDSASKVTAEDMQSGPGADITLFEVCFLCARYHCCCNKDTFACF